MLKFFMERAKKDPAKYLKFYEDYGLFIREGIVTTPEQDVRVSGGGVEGVRVAIWQDMRVIHP